jgi:pimeloyl-ACP methyl ester carboxylesterase
LAAVALATLPDGTEIWYERTGTGPPLLHIHGSGFGHRNFERLSPHLTHAFEVVDFDLPGFGASGRSRREPGLESTSDDVAELVAELGHDRIHVHGTSFGALVALLLAARHPRLVDRLVLSCFLARYDAAARAMRATWKRAARDSGMAAVSDLTAVAGFSRTFFEREECAAQLERMRAVFERTDPDVFVAATEALERTDLSPLAARVQAPTLLLGGREDTMTPLDPGASGFGLVQLRDRMPRAELVVLEDCGHYLVIEQPQEAASHIVDFLQRA